MTGERSELLGSPFLAKGARGMGAIMSGIPAEDDGAGGGLDIPAGAVVAATSVKRLTSCERRCER